MAHIGSVFRLGSTQTVPFRKQEGEKGEGRGQIRRKRRVLYVVAYQATSHPTTPPLNLFHRPGALNRYPTYANGLHFGGHFLLEALDELQAMLGRVHSRAGGSSLLRPKVSGSGAVSRNRSDYKSPTLPPGERSDYRAASDAPAAFSAGSTVVWPTTYDSRRTYSGRSQGRRLPTHL